MIPDRHIRHMLKLLWEPLPEPKGEWFRAAGDCLCQMCGHEYRLHPYDPEDVPLVVLCTGERVKL